MSNPVPPVARSRVRRLIPPLGCAAVVITAISLVVVPAVLRVRQAAHRVDIV